MATLYFLNGLNQGSQCELVGDRIVFGRIADCQVVINAPAVSREHAVLTKIGDKFYLEDMSSRNGTEVDNVKIKARTQLKDGSKIGICGNVMEFYQGSRPGGTRKRTEQSTEETARECIDALGGGAPDEDRQVVHVLSLRFSDEDYRNLRKTLER